MSQREQDITRQPAPPGMVRDVRQPPRGVLPRQLQMWLMAGLAVVILLIILVTGRTQPTPRSAASAGATAAPTPATADRIRSYQRQLADEQARQEQLDQQQRAVESRVSAPRTSPTQAAAPADPVMDEQHRRDYQSLFATNVSFSRRTNGATDGEPRSASARSETAPLASAPSAPSSGVQSNAVTEARSAVTDREAAAAEPVRAEHPATGPRLPLAEGTVIETALINRLEGTFAGPVLCLVTTPVYSQNRQHVLIPAGARVIGTSAPVQSWGDSRLAVTFHRLVMPDGHAYSLDRFKGLNQIGETGLRDEVNRHYLQVFGASLAIGAISGLAQFNTRSGFDDSFSDASRQATGASLATSTSRVLDRYLNVLPTITIREGFRIKVYLTNDFELPVYEPEKDGAP